MMLCHSPCIWRYGQLIWIAWSYILHANEHKTWNASRGQRRGITGLAHGPGDSSKTSLRDCGAPLLSPATLYIHTARFKHTQSLGNIWEIRFAEELSVHRQCARVPVLVYFLQYCNTAILRLGGVGNEFISAFHTISCSGSTNNRHRLGQFILLQTQRSDVAVKLSD